MREQFDIVIAGAGHNSLITAAFLAKAGYSCLVLEARPVIGGDTMTEELTLPGFMHDTCSTTHAIFTQSPIWANQELPLAEYGLEYLRPDPVSHVRFPDGEHLTQWTDLDRTCDEIARFSRHDADAYHTMLAEWRTVAPVFNKLRYTPAGMGPSLAEELAPHPQGAIWLRRQALSAWDIIDAAFEDWHIKAWMLWFAEGTLQPAERSGTGRWRTRSSRGASATAGRSPRAAPAACRWRLVASSRTTVASSSPTNASNS